VGFYIWIQGPEKSSRNYVKKSFRSAELHGGPWRDYKKAQSFAILSCKKSTPDNVAELLNNLPERICDVITPWSERMPDHPALVEASGTWTYRQLATAVSDTQRWLLDLGVRPGDRVMIVCENCRAFVAILLAWPSRCLAGAGQCASCRRAKSMRFATTAALAV
jgi:non-ribosomal peptide synthetase component F